jgi:hypothetical protein
MRLELTPTEAKALLDVIELADRTAWTAAKQSDCNRAAQTLRDALRFNKDK